MRSLIRSRRVALPLAALALAGTGVAAYGAVAGDGADYRTVRATTGSVEQQLSLSGVISPAGSAELAFGTGGTVAKVRVEQGEKVAQDDVIAVLDRSSLRASVDRAASDLASAEAQLADDRDAQTTAATSVPGSAGDASPTPGTASRSAPTASSRSANSTGSNGQTGATGQSDSGSAATAALVKQITAEQDAVIGAQKTASEALAAADTALADQQTACADPATTTERTETTEPGGDAGGDADDEEPDGDAGDTVTTTAVLSEACTSALAAVQAAQTTAAEAQSSLQSALTTLSGTLTRALGSMQSGGSGAGGSDAPNGSDSAGGQTPATDPGSSTPSGGDSPSTGSSASLPSGGSDGGAQQPVTAATLAQDQAAIDRAAADLAAAKADLAGAVVRAPAEGTVASLAVAVADSVSAGDAVATVVTPGLTTVAVEASATQAAQLKQGMSVTVTPAGAEQALTGSVSRVEHLQSNDSSTGTDPSYTVRIVLDERDLQLADGMPASVSVVVGTADDVVVVPASAVTNGSVTVLENGVTRQVRVTTGVVGATQVEIGDGVSEGDVVVLADLDADLPIGGTGNRQVPGRIPGGGLDGGGPAGVVVRQR